MIRIVPCWTWRYVLIFNRMTTCQTYHREMRSVLLCIVRSWSRIHILMLVFMSARQRYLRHILSYVPVLILVCARTRELIIFLPVTMFNAKRKLRCGFRRISSIDAIFVWCWCRLHVLKIIPTS